MGIDSKNFAEEAAAAEFAAKMEGQKKTPQDTLIIKETERLFDLKRQYESEIASLKETGLIETKKEIDASGVEREVLFMTGTDDKEYPLPSYETVVSRLAEQKDLLQTKADQGFTKLVLLPSGMNREMMLDVMIKKYEARLAENQPAVVKQQK